MSTSKTLAMFAVIAAFGLVMATVAILPNIPQADAKGKPRTFCFILPNGRTICHPHGTPP